MSEMTDSKLYVAPKEPPPSRKPPATEVGLIGWLKKNLFSSTYDGVITIITMVAVVYFVVSYLDWALREAQWEVAFLNLRQLLAGPDYPLAELWRLEASAFVLIFLCMFMVGFWGNLNRAILGILGATALASILVPMLTGGITEPPIYYYVDAEYDIRQVNFIAHEGDEVTFTVDPLLSEDRFGAQSLGDVYIANDNQLANTSWDRFNEVSSALGRLETGLERSGEVLVATDITQEIGELMVAGDLEGAAAAFEALGEEVLTMDNATFTSLQAPLNQFATTMLAVDSLAVEQIRNTDLAQAFGRGANPEALQAALNRFAEVLRNTLLREPTNYSLNVAVQVWDAEGNVLAESDYTNGVPEQISLTWTAPAEDWYTFTMVRDEENPGEAGYAFLIVEGVEAFISTSQEARWRQEQYGDPPELDCRGCATAVNRTDLRYEGKRTVAQWFSLQLTPFLRAIRQFFFIGVVVGAIAYVLAKLAKQQFDAKFITRSIAIAWLVAIFVWYILIKGVGGPFPVVPTGFIGGLTLTMVLTAVAVVASFPIGILLALGRSSDLPAVSVLCTLFIEVIRGVPLITLLFMGRFIVGFFVDGLDQVDVVIRVMIVLTLFTAAYLAEVIRGGLQVVPRGQIEAAQAVGLNGAYITSFIVLPQALRAVIPAILGQFLSIFKDTSLVALISIFEIVGVMQRRILGDTQTGYAAFPREGWMFVFVIFFILSYIMAEASRKLEESGAGAVRRNQI